MIFRISDTLMERTVVVFIFSTFLSTIYCQRLNKNFPNFPRIYPSAQSALKVITNTYDKVLHLRCTPGFKGQVRFEWKYYNKTLTEGPRIKIKSKNRVSDLNLRRPKAADSGSYKCNAVSNGSSFSRPILVTITPPTVVRIRPRFSQLTTDTGIFQWKCVIKQGQQSNHTYSWYLTLHPKGERRKLDYDGDTLTWRIPRRLHATQDGYDVYALTCVLNNGEEQPPSADGRFVVISPGSEESLGHCVEELLDGILWNRTLLGLTAVRFCIPNDEESGLARRVCLAIPGRSPRWKRPNLKNCASPEFTSLVDQLAALNDGFKVNTDIKQALNELRSLTRPRRRPDRPARLFGQDLLSSVGILRDSKIFLRREDKRSSFKETLDSFTETASNLVDLENIYTWSEIQESNPGTPAELVTSLDEFGFQLEEDLNGTSDVNSSEIQTNLAFEVRRYNRTNVDYMFQQNNSKIILPASVFNESNSTTVTVVSVIYNTLAAILGDVNVTVNVSSGISLFRNSQIISTTVKQLGRETFKEPVRIVLENTGSTNIQNLQRTCVFWRPEESNNIWSDEGCRLIPENTTTSLTTCECDHLTLFAVMVTGDNSDLDSEEIKKLEIISTLGSAISMAAVLLTITIYIYHWKVLWSTRFVNLMNLCLAICLLDLFSILRGSFKEDETPCEAIGVLLHFFLIALFMWMLCEGILLTLLLADVFKKHYGSKWYILTHLLGWGVPALIVTVSVAVRGVSSYGVSSHCWLTRSHGFHWAVIGPMIVVLLASCIAYGVMVHSVVTSHRIQQQDNAGKIKATVRASIIIMPVLGFTWTFAILDYFLDELFLKYIFAILNSLQGLFIFIFHCLLNKQVKQAVLNDPKANERKNILTKIKTQEMRMTGMTGSQEALSTEKAMSHD